MGVTKYRNGFEVLTHESTLAGPLKWRKPRLVFVNSMSDLFHKSVPSDFILRVFDVMNACPNHTFQVLTKRPSRILQLNDRITWTPNIWMGTSIESERWRERLGVLQRTGAAIRFLSLEPLLGPLPDLPLEGIDWVIVGGESGPKARAMKSEWVRDIRDQCVRSETAFFFKQWGGVFKKKNGRALDDEIWDQLPIRTVH